MTQYFYLPGATVYIDEFEPNTTAGIWYGKTLAELQQAYPDGQVGTYAQFVSAMAHALRSQPKVISAGEYHTARETLPIEDTHREGASESFKVKLRDVGGITAIYAKIGQCCWHFKDFADITHSDIAAKINAHQQRTEMMVQMVAKSGAVREFTVRMDGRDVVYSAPGWEPELVAKLTIVPQVNGIMGQSEDVDGVLWQAICRRDQAGFWKLLCDGSPVFAATILFGFETLEEMQTVG